MSKKCTKCEKTVYAAEELKCLDKTWHKTCFKCWECGMQLTMKNYKGYSKLPYCSAHYPQTKHTVVKDTPESARLQKITDLNSNINYHKEFEMQKGTCTSLAEDPETARVKGLSSVISPNAYSGGGGGGGASTGYTQPMRVPDDDFGDEGGPAHSHGGGGGGGGRQGMPLPNPPPAAPASHGGLTYMALYDYDAQDNDEVSFQENDKIVDCEVIDEGWVTGTVERTGKKGMIPANYVEQA